MNANKCWIADQNWQYFSVSMVDEGTIDPCQNDDSLSIILTSYREVYRTTGCAAALCTCWNLEVVDRASEHFCFDIQNCKTPLLIRESWCQNTLCRCGQRCGPVKKDRYALMWCCQDEHLMQWKVCESVRDRDMSADWTLIVWLFHFRDRSFWRSVVEQIFQNSIPFC